MNIIDIPNEALIGSRHCYNCSIIEWKSKVYLFYRYLLGRYETEIGVCELNGDFKPIEGTNRRVPVMRFCPKNGTSDDPRAFLIGDKMHLLTCQGHLVHSSKDWVWATSIAFSQIQNIVSNPVNVVWTRLIDFGKNINSSSKNGAPVGTEKNWTPFSGHATPRFLHTINPLVVFDYNEKTGNATELSRSQFDQSFWEWGDFLAGSTPLIKWGDEWLSFFHSYIHESEFNRRKYFVGAFTLNSQPPYRVLRMSKEPFLSAEMNEEHDLRHASQGWLPNCIFPCGLIKKNDRFYLSYGWQDCRCKIAEFSEEELNQNLKNID